MICRRMNSEELYLPGESENSVLIQETHVYSRSRPNSITIENFRVIVVIFQALVTWKDVEIEGQRDMQFLVSPDACCLEMGV